MMLQVLIVSFLYNAEAYPSFTVLEMKTLEQVQGKIIREILEVPMSTPYFPLLLETGMWTMEARINYKKLMLYHNIMNSDDNRLIKNIVIEQKRCLRPGTWYHSITKIIQKYSIELSENVLKSQWKRHVKTQIQTVVETEIRSGCNTSDSGKGRTVCMEDYSMKTYMKELPVDVVSDILKVRLHMVRLPCNYGDKDKCWLCDNAVAKTEHYLRCPGTILIRECMGIVSDSSFANLDTDQLVKISQFYKKLELRSISCGGRK